MITQEQLDKWNAIVDAMFNDDSSQEEKSRAIDMFGQEADEAFPDLLEEVARLQKYIKELESASKICTTRFDTHRNCTVDALIGYRKLLGKKAT